MTDSGRDDLQIRKRKTFPKEKLDPSRSFSSRNQNKASDIRAAKIGGEKLVHISERRTEQTDYDNTRRETKERGVRKVGEAVWCL